MAGKSGSPSSKLEEQHLEKSPPRVEITTSPTPGRVKQPPSSPIQGVSPSKGPQEGDGITPDDMQAILVVGGGGGGGSSDDTAAGTCSLEPRAASRKRVRDDSKGLSLVAAEGVIDQHSFKCYVCGKGFPTNRSLFDHTRTHHGHEWKGTEDAFAAMSPSNPEGGEERPSKQEIEQVDEEATPGFAIARDAWEDINLNKEPEPELESPDQEYCIPDLNHTPPSDCD